MKELPVSDSDLYIHWFRDDLRLADNPALFEALAAGRVLPVFVLDESSQKFCALGSASKWWLHEALGSLNESLNGRLLLSKGDPKKLIPELAKTHGAKAVFWNRRYEPDEKPIDEVVSEELSAQGVETHVFNGALLWEPWDVLKGDGTPYRVFTPFFRRGCLSRSPPDEPVGFPSSLCWAEKIKSPVSLTELNLLPEHDWYQGLRKKWTVSEQQAQIALDTFLEEKLPEYGEHRDFPASAGTSNLSPYIRWGQVSIHRVYEKLRTKMLSQEMGENGDRYFSQLAWREFGHNLLYHFPELPDQNMQKKFDGFPWVEDNRLLEGWKAGMTGIPFVDAAMRELWQTGFMHNRLRMVVGSFLVKNLLIDWRRGRDWFWDCLVDADLANNSMGWQWIAGCGVDAAPYFRVFNPVLQGKKFDPQGSYTRHFVPELEKLPEKYLFSPWEAPESILREAGVILGETYPRPLVDLKRSRVRALEAYTSIRGDDKITPI